MVKSIANTIYNVSKRSKQAVETCNLFFAANIEARFLANFKGVVSVDLEKEKKNIIIIFFCLLLLFKPSISIAASSVPSLVTMLANLAAQQPTLLKFVTGFSVLIGFLMAFRALYQLKEYGEMRTMMASNTDLRKPVMTFFIALVLIYWKEVLDAMMYATFRTSSPLEYEATGWIYDDVMNMAGMLIQLIGVIAFIRGWVLLTHIGQQGSQPGMLGKALTHIFGGLFAVNIFGTFKILKGTLGIS